MMGLVALLVKNCSLASSRHTVSPSPTASSVTPQFMDGAEGRFAQLLPMKESAATLH
jgi:hypothetical protein